MFSNWNEWYILRHCHFAVRSVNDPRVPKNIQCGSQKWIGLQRTATKLVKTTMSSLCNGSMDQWISLRWFEALSTTSRISRLQASSNKLQSDAGTRHVNGLDPGCLCLGFWFVVICDDLTWDLVIILWWCVPSTEDCLNRRPSDRPVHTCTWWSGSTSTSSLRTWWQSSWRRLQRRNHRHTVVSCMF